MKFSGVAASAIALAAAVSADSASSVAEKVASLRASTTEVERLKLLQDDEVRTMNKRIATRC